MATHQLLGGLRRLGVNESTTNNTLFTQYNSSIGWSNFGGVVDNSVGNPTPSYKFTTGNYAYNNIVPYVSGFLNITCTFQIYAIAGAPLCDFFFGCNSSGVGNMWRLECRGGNVSGFTTTTSWTTWNNPSGGIVYNAATWYSARLVINTAGVAQMYINGVASQSPYTMANNGAYFGFQGDGGSGGNFQDLTITFTN